MDAGEVGKIVSALREYDRAERAARRVGPVPVLERDMEWAMEPCRGERDWTARAERFETAGNAAGAAACRVKAREARRRRVGPIRRRLELARARDAAEREAVEALRPYRTRWVDLTDAVDRVAPETVSTLHDLGDEILCPEDADAA